MKKRFFLCERKRFNPKTTEAPPWVSWHHAGIHRAAIPNAVVYAETADDAFRVMVKRVESAYNMPFFAKHAGHFEFRMLEESELLGGV